MFSLKIRAERSEVEWRLCEKCCLLEAPHASWLIGRAEDCIFWQAEEKKAFFSLCKVVPIAFQTPKHLADLHCLILAAKSRVPPCEEFLMWLCEQNCSAANWGVCRSQNRMMPQLSASCLVSLAVDTHHMLVRVPASSRFLKPAEKFQVHSQAMFPH